MEKNVTVIKRPKIPSCFADDNEKSKAFLLGYLLGFVENKSHF